MKDNLKLIKENYLNSTFDNEESLAYIGERLKEIRAELKTNEKIDKNDLNGVLEFNATLINRLEENKGVAYQEFIKVLNLYKAFGYNPLWIITKDNIFINKHDIDSEVILNTESVSEALNNLMNTFNDSQQNLNKAFEQFKSKLS